MRNYRGIFMVDTSFVNRLDGRYCVEGYTIIPCVMTPENQQRGCSNFVLQFDFEGVNETPHLNSHEKARIFGANMVHATEKARMFISWLVTATKHWARLSHDNLGPVLKSGPCIYYPMEEFDEHKLSMSYHIDEKAKPGEFFHIKRPCFQRSTTNPEENFKLPSDFPTLTRKLLSLEKKEKNKYVNACLSYQFALETYTAYPTISILSLVSAVESIIADQYTSRYCNRAGIRCNLKTDIMKKFRMFFERTLVNPLPVDLQRFLNRVYAKRSSFVHQFLLGVEGTRAIPFIFASFQGRRLCEEQRNLNSLVNAALIEWLRKI